MDRCNYVDPKRARLGILRENGVVSHVIYDNELCIQSDDEKTRLNIENLNKETVDELPIYCIISHGEIITDINVNVVKDKVVDVNGSVAVDKYGNVLMKNTYHINTPKTTFFNLQPSQYVYDTAPIGTSLACSSHLNKYINRIVFNPAVDRPEEIDKPNKFKNILFGRAFQSLSKSITLSTINFDAPMFSPPQYSTINKHLEFYDKKVNSSLRFGVVRLDKPITSEIKQALDSIGKPLTTNTEQEKQSRCLNIGIGNITGNTDIEQRFVQHLYLNKFKCTLQELTTIFGPGIYIMATCSQLELKIKVNRETITYSSYSTTGIKKHSSPYGRNVDVSKALIDKIVYAFNEDLEDIVRNLEYRWIEMVQHNNYNEDASFNNVQNNPGGKYGRIVDMDQEEEEETQTETETETEDEDEEMSGNTGGKKKKKHTTKKRKQTKKNKKHIKQNTKHKKQKTKKHLKRRRQQSRARRS
jgi:hypothetical protein